MLLTILSDWLTTLSLIFGGCCSNAITLEQLTSQYPDTGSLITFFQFILISLHGLPKHITWTSTGPRFKPRHIPLTSYLIQVALFYFISLLNNAAFAYRIPMPVHIIFRSGGLIVSMILGWLISGKKYSLTQILSVLLVTFGVALTTLSAQVSTKENAQNQEFNAYTYASGIGILSLALLFSGFLGLVQDRTYSKYGRPVPPSSKRETPSTPKGDQTSPQPATWQESMFYLHILALPMFIPLLHDLSTQLSTINAGPQIALSLPNTTFPLSSSSFSKLSIQIPVPYFPLLLNTITQLICVAGVHRLTTRVSALSVTLVLVVRKAVSLVFSVLGFGMLGGSRASRVDERMMWAGAGMVLAGTVTYSIATGGKKGRDGGKNKEE